MIATTRPRPIKDPQPADNLILWLPVFLSCGIGGYFSLSSEPSIWVSIIGFILSMLVSGLTFRWRYAPPWRWLAAFSIAFFFGLFLIQTRVMSVDTEILNRRVWSSEITGTIQSFERAGTGWRVMLEKSNLKDDPQSYVFRMTLRQKGFNPQVGGVLHAKASLMQPSSPLVPGSYDFRQHAFFQGISAYGYVTKILDYQPPAVLHETNRLEEYRDWLTEKVYAVLEQPEAGIVTAMLNGQRAGISRQTTQVLQQSGLQHVISISGLHVGLMAITIFYVTRLLMALNMSFALRFPIKKFAAGFALAGIIFYLLIVGNSPPTLRSVIMSGIALIAIMLDREPIQMRVVALSGIFILLLQPESLIDIGFQMSFAAVIGLVAFFQHTRKFWTHQRWQDSIFLKAARALLVTVVTSLIATVVTAPLVILYFQQIPLLSMLSNVMATPPITFLIMPGTFLSYLFTPFPFLGELSIRMMGLGVKLMMDVAYFVAKLPSAVLTVRPLGLTSIYLIMIGIYGFIVIKNHWRWAGMVVVLAGLMLIPFKQQPDFLMMQNRVILYPDANTNRLFVEGRLGGFEKNMMLQWTAKKKTIPFECTEDICEIKSKGKTIRIIRTVEALKQACHGKADLILTRYYLDWTCGETPIIDRHVLEKEGAQAVYLAKQIKIDAVLPYTQRRPWQ